MLNDRTITPVKARHRDAQGEFSYCGPNQGTAPTASQCFVTRSLLLWQRVRTHNLFE
jgi:hypothetical protein